MNRDAIVFAMANPTPEVMPEDAEPHVRIMATGRSDYPNQINNVLCFPGIFRGALDAGAPRITEEMKLAAAKGIAAVVTDDDLNEDYIIPSVFDRDVAPAVAEAVVREAKNAGIARINDETGTFATVPSVTEMGSRMKVLVTGATGTIGEALCEALLARGDEVVGLSRNPDKARAKSPDVTWHAWNPALERPPAEALTDVDGVINLVGEPINQRWTAEAKDKIWESRVRGTENLVAAMLAAPETPRTMVSQSAVGYYGDRGDDDRRRVDPGRIHLRRQGLRRLGGRGQEGRAGRHAAGDHSHRPAADQERGTARRADASLQARRRRPRRRRSQLHAVDQPRR